MSPNTYFFTCFQNYLYKIYAIQKYNRVIFSHNVLPNNFPTILGIIAHNVPAVYDVFASPINETVGFQGLQKCGWSRSVGGVADLA
jgi:hypothetical protein